MKIYIPGPYGELVLQKGLRIVVEFADGESLELTDSPQPIPAEIPHGIHVWGGRMPSQTSEETKTSPLNITPVAANGMIIAPRRAKTPGAVGIAMFIVDDAGSLQPVKDNKVVIELQNGKTIEFMEDYAKEGLLVWGGREPDPELSFEETQQRTESLGLYPLAGNLIHVFAYQLAQINADAENLTQ